MRLDRFPIPPSVNKMYATYNGRRIPTRELKEFQTRAESYVWQNLALFRREAALLHLDELPNLQALFTFYLPFQTLYTKANKPKKWDVSNRVKALEDVLFALLDADDSLVFKLSAEKRVIPNNMPYAGEGWVEIQLNLLEPQIPLEST